MSNWFKNWFEKPLNPIGFDCLKTDMHSHLIPNIDDGASSLEDSIKMITALRKLGFQKIITTPHVMSDFYKNTPETINAGLALVRAELQKNKIDRPKYFNFMGGRGRINSISDGSLISQRFTKRHTCYFKKRRACSNGRKSN